jgi:hypothetical protein
MKLLLEIQESVKYLVEGEGAAKKHYITGLMLEFDNPNKNNRIYRSETHDPVVQSYINEKINSNRAFGELDHPDSPTINLKNVSHIVKELHKIGSNWHGKAEITNTPSGNIVKGLLESEANLGVSSRGLGSLKQIGEHFEVQPDYKLITVNDIVSDPSAHGAFVKGIMEGVEYLWNDQLGWISEEVKKDIKKMSLKEIEEKKMRMFENFIQRIQNNK